MRVIDAVKETIADVSSMRANVRNVSYCFLHTASITLISTHLIHQFVFSRADAVT